MIVVPVLFESLQPCLGEQLQTPSDARSVVVYDRDDFWRLGPSYSRAFEKLDWNATLFDTGRRKNCLRWWVRSRIGNRLTRRSLALRRSGSRDWNQALVRWIGAGNPDLFLVMNGAFLMPETVRRLQGCGVPVAVVYADDPTPGSGNFRPEYLPVAQEADLSFVWSRRLKARLEEHGAKARYLPFGWDPEVFPYIEDMRQEGPEAVFIGGWDRKREQWLEPVAKRFDLAIWGPGYWGTRTRLGSPLRDCWQGGALRGREAAEAVAGAGIALNILRDQNLPDGTNMRTFEVPGAGGFLLATRTSGATEIYPEDEAGAYFGSQGELLKKIDYFLEHEEERKAIARRAHEITARKNRYVHRAREILESVELTAK